MCVSLFSLSLTAVPGGVRQTFHLSDHGNDSGCFPPSVTITDLSNPLREPRSRFSGLRRLHTTSSSPSLTLSLFLSLFLSRSTNTPCENCTVSSLACVGGKKHEQTGRLQSKRQPPVFIYTRGASVISITIYDIYFHDTPYIKMIMSACSKSADPSEVYASLELSIYVPGKYCPSNKNISYFPVEGHFRY